MAVSGWWLNCYCVACKRCWSPGMQAACLLQCPGCIYTGLGSIGFLLEIWKGDHFAEFQSVAFKQAEKLILSVFNLWNSRWKRFQNTFKPGQWLSHKRFVFFSKVILILKTSLNKDVYIRTTIATVFVRDFFHELGNSWLLCYCQHTGTVKKKLGGFIIELFC